MLFIIIVQSSVLSRERLIDEKTGNKLLQATAPGEELMGCAGRLIIDRVDACGIQSVTQIFGPLGILLRTYAHEEHMHLVIESLTVLEHSAIHIVEIGKVDASGSAETAYIGKLVEIVERGVEM